MKALQVVENASEQKCRKCSVICLGMLTLTFSSNPRPDRLSKKACVWRSTLACALERASSRVR